MSRPSASHRRAVRLASDRLAAARVEQAPPSELAAAEHALGAARYAAFLRTGDPEWLDGAASSFRSAVETEGGGSARPAYLNNLAVALTDRYELGGDPDDLVEATAMAHSALSVTARDAPDWADYAATLSVCRWNRYDATGLLVDLEAALLLTGLALDAVAEDARIRPRLCSNLAMLLLDRYERRNDPADVEASVALAQAAVTTSRADDPDRPGWLNNLGNALRLRFAAQFGGHDSPFPTTTVKVGDLVAAVEAYRTAVRLAPRRAVARSTFLSNLGDALVDLGAVENLQDRPERALRTLREAAKASRHAVTLTRSGAPYLPSRLNGLGVALRWIAERTHRPDDVDAARRAFREACREGLAQAPEMTVVAADNWTRWTLARGAWAEAAEADDYLLQAAETLQRTQVTGSHRRDWLVALRGLGEDATYAAVRRGHSADAVVRMERARAVLLSEALALSPQALARLPPPLRARHAAAVEAVSAAQQALAAGPARALR